MKEFKGTPGEWVINLDTQETKINTKKYRIADVKHFNSKIHPELLEPSLEQGQANAKLIAAAPELLRALQVLLREIPEDLKKDCLWGECTKAERSISKALD